MQCGAAHAPARPGAKPRLGPALLAYIRDALERDAGRVHIEGLQLRQTTRHQSLAARLVDRALPRVCDDDREPPFSCVQCGGESAGATADDQHVGVVGRHE